ncbi:heme ABC transporter ATP-binding protein [Halobacteriales archaeon QS_4_62_28]|nr:MAG: heme ABC transporter ATP-binding protein [Halobacteriales archaeon QS_4_62_28]
MAGPDSRETVVRLDGITKRFGSVVANDGIDFELDDGTVHALVGENGSGKTTLMSVLYGLYDQDEGRIVVDGEPRTFDSPRDAIDAGIGMIHQHFQLVEPMTVLQNSILGHEPTTYGMVDEERARADIEAICSRYDFDVDEHLDTPVRDLDLGVQQRVEIVKSLYRGAEVLVLDEPTAVLTPQEVDRLFDLMGELRDQGTSLIFITHKLEEAMEIADRISVLRDGEKVGTIAAADATRERLAEMMVGREVLFDDEQRATETGEVVLEVDGLRVSDDRGLERVSGVDFDLRRGEIFGIAGVEGNGQAQLVQAVTGRRDVDDGRIRFQGEDMTDISRRDAIEAGIAYIPQDRLEDGLVLEDDLVRNALLGFQTLAPFVGEWFIDWDGVRDHADRIIDEYDVKPPDRTRLARSLSGGNQQKFVVGRELSHDPDLLVASHPTRGVDIGSIEFIHSQLLDMRDDGLPIVLVSSKLEEIQNLADRIAVMYEGEFVDTVRPDDVTEQDLGLLMTGHREAAGETPPAARDGGDLS